MTKKELVERVVDSTVYHKEHVSGILEALIGVMSDALILGERIDIRGFGNLVVITRKAKKGRNIKAGTEVMIPETRKPKFIASAYLLDKLNGKKS